MGVDISLHIEIRRREKWRLMVIESPLPVRVSRQGAGTHVDWVLEHSGFGYQDFLFGLLN